MAMNKRKKFKILLTIEILVVAALGVALAGLVLLDDVKQEDVDKKNIGIEHEIEGFTNIMLFGVDAREDQLTKDTRSDTMILVTINEKTKEVSLTSFYRDYYSYAPHKAGSTPMDQLSDKCFDKLTHAYIHGPENALKTINMNFQLDVTDYVTVNFIALVRVVDALGGIELNVDKQFMINEINKYGGEIARKNGESFKRISKTGVQTLNGYQALGYARTRKKDSDFNRAQRQREVINKVLEKMKSVGTLPKLTSIYKSVTNNMVTSFSEKEILDLLKDVTKYSIRKETGSGFGNGYPYNVASFKYKGTYLVFSKLPYSDISLLHYNLFNNGVLPEQLQTPAPEGSTPAPTSDAKSLNYIYTPKDNLLKITNYLTNVYNQNSPDA